MPGLSSGGFYDRYAQQTQASQKTLGMMGQYGNKTTMRNEKSDDEDDDKELLESLLLKLELLDIPKR